MGGAGAFVFCAADARECGFAKVFMAQRICGLSLWGALVCPELLLDLSDDGAVCAGYEFCRRSGNAFAVQPNSGAVFRGFRAGCGISAEGE
jgi:hypothetical protein